MNKTFIVLVPKRNNLEEVSHFRSISLCNVVYKVIAKVLVSKLKTTLSTLISLFKNIFMDGKQISDNIILCLGQLGYIKRKKERYGQL